MRSFKTVADFRTWLETNHGREKELTLRLFKVHARHKGIGYKEALDEALCFGWIDGVRRAHDEDSFTQRFTPRKLKSNWSTVNIKRATELEAEGRMHAAGLAAFRARDTTKVAPYSFESPPLELDAALLKKFQANKRAWTYFQSRPPGYRRICTFFVMGAKRDETRARRLQMLIEYSAKGKPLPMLG